MKIVWNQVTWYSKLLTLGVFVGLFGFGLYVGEQYSVVLQTSPAAVYFRIYERIPVLATPIFFNTGSTTQTTVFKKITTPDSSNIKPSKTLTTTNTQASSTATSTTVTIPPPAVAVIPPTTTLPPVIILPPATTPPVITAPASAPAQAGEVRFTAYTTGYGWPDNTPPSAEISNPIIHQLAGGTGTFTDPITVAVGHTISGSNDTLDYAEGTKFYVPNLRRYFIVEDTCGDGNTPQNGPCHTGYQGHVWLDLWIGGEGVNKQSVLACEDTVTNLFLVIQNPTSNYAVVEGPVYNGSCGAQYGDTVVSS